MPKDIPGVMREFKGGQLHSGSRSGPVVKNRKQAVAIALSEQRQKSGTSGLYTSRKPAKEPPQMAGGSLTVRNQLRGQKGQAR